jgi:hypothetical protein
MNPLREHKTYLLIVYLAASILISGCHGTPPAATAEVELPVIKQAVISPQVLPDGSLRIPRTTLLEHIGTTGVFILSEDSQARFRMLKTGKSNADWIMISSGLTGQESILRGPFDAVFDGSPVQLINADEE